MKNKGIKKADKKKASLMCKTLHEPLYRNKITQGAPTQETTALSQADMAGPHCTAPLWLRRDHLTTSGTYTVYIYISACSTHHAGIDDLSLPRPAPLQQGEDYPERAGQAPSCEVRHQVQRRIGLVPVTTQPGQQTFGRNIQRGENKSTGHDCLSFGNVVSIAKHFL